MLSILVLIALHDVSHNKFDHLDKSMSNQPTTRCKQRNRSRQDASNNHDLLSMHTLQHHQAQCSSHTAKKNEKSIHVKMISNLKYLAQRYKNTARSCFNNTRTFLEWVDEMPNGQWQYARLDRKLSFANEDNDRNTD